MERKNTERNVNNLEIREENELNVSPILSPFVFPETPDVNEIPSIYSLFPDLFH